MPALYTFLVLVFLILLSGIRIVNEYERGVIFRLGRLVGARGPGLFYVIPIIEKMRKVDLRIVTLDVPKQDIITKDNITVKVNAVCYFQVLDPEKAIVKIANYLMATSQIAQTTLRSVLGQVELDELLTDREKVNERLQHIIDEQTDPWGVKVTVVEVKDVDLPDTMQRAIARQAEAERERRAIVIGAKGEYEAATKLAEAAEIMARHPAALQLRYLKTLSEISTENTTTVVFPLPLDVIEPFIQMMRAFKEDHPEQPPQSPDAAFDPLDPLDEA